MTAKQKKKRPDRCPSCGGTEFVEAVDNHGQPYIGCANCTIVLPPELLPTSRRRAALAIPNGLLGSWMVVVVNDRAETVRVLCTGLTREGSQGVADRFNKEAEHGKVSH